MGSELNIVALYGLFIIVVIVAQVLAAMSQVGLGALASPRDDAGPLTGVAGRLDRALRNCVVAMVLFAPAVLIVELKGVAGGGSLLAAQVFLIARVLYVPIYAAGIPWVRTLVWAAGLGATVALYIFALTAGAAPA